MRGKFLGMMLVLFGLAGFAAAGLVNPSFEAPVVGVGETQGVPDIGNAPDPKGQTLRGKVILEHMKRNGSPAKE